MATPRFSLHSSWSLLWCTPLANCRTSKRTFTKSREQLKMIPRKSRPARKHVTWLQPLNNQFPPCTRMSKLSHKHYHIDLQAPLLVSERRLVPMARMSGAYLESINLRRLSNSYIVILQNLGKNLMQWLAHLKSSTRPLNCHITS